MESPDVICLTIARFTQLDNLQHASNSPPSLFFPRIKIAAQLMQEVEEEVDEMNSMPWA